MLVASRRSGTRAIRAAAPPPRAAPKSRRKDWVMAIAPTIGMVRWLRSKRRALSMQVDSRKPEQFGLQIPRVRGGFNGRRDRSARRERV